LLDQEFAGRFQAFQRALLGIEFRTQFAQRFVLMGDSRFEVDEAFFIHPVVSLVVRAIKFRYLVAGSVMPRK
jgi:hypothetical protein